jgi:predicted phosphoribosyltransferase
MATFTDRRDAGRQLAERLAYYEGRNDVVVLALPRGGLPVGDEVAKRLHAPLDVYVVRKLGAPGNPELAMGAIASGGGRVLNERIVSALGVSQDQLRNAEEAERKELSRREEAYRRERESLDTSGRHVILVDDGLATGATMRAAVEALRASNPSGITVAVPTAAPETCESFTNLVDEVVCVVTPQPFGGVGMWYDSFPQTTDEEVRSILHKAEERLN